MKKSEIVIGACYRAKVGAKVTVVRVDAIREDGSTSKRNGIHEKAQTQYDVTNLATNRRTTFRSAMKFREKVQESFNEGAKPWPKNPVTGETVDSQGSFNRAVSDILLRGDEQRGPFSPTFEQPTQQPLPSGVPASPSQPVVPLLSSPAAAVAVPAAPGSLSSILRSAAAPPAPHLIVEARAGTGKTTTLICALQVLKGQIPTDARGNVITPSDQQRAVWDQVALSAGAKSVGFVAFNKSIAQELQARVPPGVDAMTMHSLGYRAVTKMFGRLEPSSWAVQDIIADELKGDLRQLRKDQLVLVTATERLVALCKQNLVDVNKITEEALDKLAAHYDVDLDKYRANVYQLVPCVLDRCRSPKGKISFDDMIWLPIVHDLPLYRYDLLMVDESQDLNRCQQALAKKAGHRLILVGDPKQAIYGFAGADAESMKRMAVELGGTPQGCDVLPLTVTRRCGRAIVAEANRIVPDFQAHKSNPAGVIKEARYPGKYRDNPEVKWEDSYGPQVQDGDMVLCRCNAPLVTQCFRFIKLGRKANIQGRDIGAGLVSTVNKMKAESVTDLIHRLSEWLNSETAKEQAKRFPSENRITSMQDRVDCLMCFCEGARSVQDVIDKIESVFTDDKTNRGIRLSSIHRAKGLEASNVFILKPPGVGPRQDKMQPWELEQESNLRYVAITRAIEQLTYVS